MNTDNLFGLKNLKKEDKNKNNPFSKLKNFMHLDRKDENLEIVLEEKNSLEIKNKMPPSNELGYDLHKHGEISDENISIYISMETISQVKKHALENMNIELGGMLIGEVNENNGKKYVDIIAGIAAQHTSQNGASVTFTHQTWDQVFRTMDKDYPDKIIVGWYHTHPNFGVFLSGDDLFIHKNFFNQEWHVAFVLDPVKNYSGFFHWKNGEIVKSSGYYIYKKIDNSK